MTMTWSEQTGIEALYRNQSLDNAAWECADVYNRAADLLEIPEISSQEHMSTEFSIPEYYTSINVEEYVHNLCPDDAASKHRIKTELAMYDARNLYDVLKLMIYIVDTLKKNNIVWGVGRGSSVASYVLYLLGVHRINSLTYNLDIQEFLK
jgi:DNA polymerase III alpha subunit